MGKRKIDKITCIQDLNARKVTLCKRKKGLIKKAIELSVLCDQKIIILIKDESKKRVTHFVSHKDLNLLQVFNEMNKRDFYSNNHYWRVGGLANQMDIDWQDIDGESIGVPASDEDIANDSRAQSKVPNKRSK